MATLRLQASDGNALKILLINETDYCGVFLETKNEAIKLGEDSFEQIRTKMMSSLSPPYDTEKGVLCGKKIDVFWVLSLMGPHAAIYGVPVKEDADENNSNAIWGADLYWQTVEMVDHLIMRLSPEDIQSWLKILKNTEQLPAEK